MRILFATDGSNDAKTAAAFLEQLPVPESSRVRVVAVTERHPIDLPALRPYYDALAAERQRVVDETCAPLSGRATIETTVLQGVARDEIVREAKEWGADLVVVGARGLDAVETFLLGSVSLAVARHVEAAVLVVKGHGHRLQRLVVGLDGSEESLNAARFVAALPLDARHSVRLVGVVEPVHFPSTAPFVIHEQIQGVIHEIKQERRDALTKAMDQVAPLFEAQGVSVSRTIANGHPAEALTATTAEADTDLVVVGARGLGGVKRWLLGSVSENVLRSARCSVLIVKGPR